MSRSARKYALRDSIKHVPNTSTMKNAQSLNKRRRVLNNIRDPGNVSLTSTGSGKLINRVESD